MTSTYIYVSFYTYHMHDNASYTQSLIYIYYKCVCIINTHHTCIIYIGSTASFAALHDTDSVSAEHQKGLWPSPQNMEFGTWKWSTIDDQMIWDVWEPFETSIANLLTFSQHIVLLDTVSREFKSYYKTMARSKSAEASATGMDMSMDTMSIKWVSLI